MDDFLISGQLIDVHQRRTYPAAVWISNGVIASISECTEAPARYLLPGFIDAHVHIESSMLTPAQFARIAVTHGTIATVSDPHEIANVCGADGVDWMIHNAATVPFKCFFGAPSCVPATPFETAGAVLDAPEIDQLLARPDIWYLAEMMNYPGVLHQDAAVMAKIAAAKRHGKPIDGHAPGLTGSAAHQYAQAGISTDHECTTLAEALDKVAAGMRILIREGSAAKNFDALHPLFAEHADKVMFCSDDKHPDDLLVGHIDQLVKRALALGYNLYDVLRAACVNPVLHYKLPVGLLRVGDSADFIVLENLADWKPLETYVGGRKVAEQGKALFDTGHVTPINHFLAEKCSAEDFAWQLPTGASRLRVIQAHEGQLLTSQVEIPISKEGLPGLAKDDVLKLVVLNRYETKAAPAIAFIKGFGLKHGALASTVAHDCHNIIAIGVDDESICAAINAVVDAKGGIAVAESATSVSRLALPIAGLMSDASGEETGEAYAALSLKAKELGSPLNAPFMTLSFMALLVIPALKLSDKGLFDGSSFTFASLAY